MWTKFFPPGGVFREFWLTLFYEIQISSSILLYDSNFPRWYWSCVLCRAGLTILIPRNPRILVPVKRSNWKDKRWFWCPFKKARTQDITTFCEIQGKYKVHVFFYFDDNFNATFFCQLISVKLIYDNFLKYFTLIYV